MIYNNNIILNILQSEFWDEIEIYVAGCILDFDDWNSNDTFENIVDYAELDSIDEMVVDSYNIEENPDGVREYISGMMEIRSYVDGYVHWDGEDMVVDSGEVSIGVQFSFYAEDDKYYNLELEHIY